MTDEDRTFLEGLYELHPDSPKNRDEEPLEPEIVIYLDGEVLDRDSASLERIQGMMSETYGAALERVSEPEGEIRRAYFKTLAKQVDILERIREHYPDSSMDPLSNNTAVGYPEEGAPYCFAFLDSEGELVLSYPEGKVVHGGAGLKRSTQ